MDVGMLASSFVAARTAQLQLAVAAAMMRMDAQQEASIAELVAAADENVQQMVDAVAGVGGNLDVRIWRPCQGRVAAAGKRAARISLSASSLAHSAGPASEATSQPAGSISSVVGMPNALPMTLRS
jgi:hypothetical protein